MNDDGIEDERVKDAGMEEDIEVREDVGGGRPACSTCGCDCPDCGVGCSACEITSIAGKCPECGCGWYLSKGSSLVATSAKE